MEQRPLRLGDTVDDYCPRDRRITNHLVVALLGEIVKRTRCSTCDAEHVYKGGRMPTRKRKSEIAALETAVLASVNGTQLVARIDPGQGAARQAGSMAPAEAGGPQPSAELAGLPAAPTIPNGQTDGPPQPAEGTPSADPLPGAWIGNRTLIRATLPRSDSDPPPARPIPEFTMHQRQPRGGFGFRNGQGWTDRGRSGPRGNFAGGNGGPSGPERNGNVNGNGNGNSYGHGNPHGNGYPGPGNGQGHPPGNGGRRRRHGKHRRSH